MPADGKTVFFCPALLNVYSLRFTFYVSVYGYCILFAFYVYVLRFTFGLWSWSPGHGYGYTHVYVHGSTGIHVYILYKPNTTVLRYYICNQKILTMTLTQSYYQDNIEILNDLYLIVAGTDLSKGRINKGAIETYLLNQIELNEDLLERDLDEWESRD